MLNKDRIKMATNPMVVSDFMLNINLQREYVANNDWKDVENDGIIEGTVNINVNMLEMNPILKLYLYFVYSLY